LTTKVLALTDALGNLVRFRFLPGQRSEIVGVPDLIEGLSFGALLADKAFDADHLRAELETRNAQAVIPAKRNRLIHIPHDEEAYKWRHLIENYFCKIKEFRGVNTRYDKTDVSYQATWDIAATIIALR
jgi:transposase